MVGGEERAPQALVVLAASRARGLEAHLRVLFALLVKRRVAAPRSPHLAWAAWLQTTLAALDCLLLAQHPSRAPAWVGNMQALRRAIHRQ